MRTAFSGTADEMGDLQGLLHETEEQLHLPAPFIKISDLPLPVNSRSLLRIRSSLPFSVLTTISRYGDLHGVLAAIG